MPFIALVFSANFTKTAVKCKQTAEKSNLSDFCDTSGCSHCLQYQFWKSVIFTYRHFDDSLIFQCVLKQKKNLTIFTIPLNDGCFWNQKCTQCSGQIMKKWE